MKKLLVLFMMVAMVMGFSFNVMANTYSFTQDANWSDVGNIYEGQVEFDGPKLGVEVEILPYARIEVVRNPSFFAEAPGQIQPAEIFGLEGIYTNDGSIFTGMVQSAYSEDRPVVLEGISGGSEENLATIKVKTNAPIQLSFEWDDANWMPDVDTFLAIWERDKTPATDNMYGGEDFAQNNANVAAIFDASVGDYVAAFGSAPNEDNLIGDLNLSASVLQFFAHCNEREYELKAGFHLEKDVTQVPAGFYTGTVHVTAEEVGIVVDPS